jgi:cysteine desulfurase/selenocysteine lyase
MSLDVYTVRNDFPALGQLVHGHYPLVYLDNAATTLKPRPVVDAMTQYYRVDTGNIHRGVHQLSQHATEKYENTRTTVARFIQADSPDNIVFTSGTTAAINMVAQGYVRKRLDPGDEIVITHMEHHSNIVPWQMLCEQTGAILKVAPVDDQGAVCLDAYDALLTRRTRFVSLAYVSNALGTVNPVERMIDMAHARDIAVLVDAAQAVSTLPVDVSTLNCDFLAFSGHKLYGPTGVGVLYGKAESLEQMDPVFGGGDMVLSVSFEKTMYNRIPNRFEAGTPPIAEVIGLGAAIDYVVGIGVDHLANHARFLMHYTQDALADIPGVRLIGTSPDKTGIVSFVLEEAHAHDIGTILDSLGVAIRVGHHCAQPIMQRFGIAATARASFALYNTPADVDHLIAAVHKVREVFVS